MPYEPPEQGFRTFLAVWATQSVSCIGSVVTFFATTIWLAKSLYPLPGQKPELAWALSAISLARMLPLMICSPLAGAWADRHDRKRTMMATDAFGALLCMTWAALLVTHRMSIPALLAITFLAALADAYHEASFETSFAMLVTPEQLPRANGMMQTTFSLSAIIGPGIAAAIFALPAIAQKAAWGGTPGSLLGVPKDGMVVVLALDALTFSIAAAVPLFLHVPSPRRGEAEGARPSTWDDVKEGTRYIWQRPPLLWLLAVFTMANFMMAPFDVFMPLLVKYNLVADWQPRGFAFETALALMTMTFGVGGLFGGAIVSLWGGLRRRRALGVIVPMLVGTMTMPVFGLTGSLYMAASMSVIAGLMDPIVNAHSHAIWQNQTPVELQGRVFSVRRVISMCTLPLGTALGGWAGARFDPGHAIAFLGVMLTIFTAAQLFNRTLLRVDDREWLDSLAERSLERV